MMFVIRTTDNIDVRGPIEVKAIRKTPPTVAGSGGRTDYFCVAPRRAMDDLRDSGLKVVELQDGWYEDDQGGGIAIWAQGTYWETRSDPLTVKEAAGPVSVTREMNSSPDEEAVNVRRAIFEGRNT